MRTVVLRLPLLFLENLQSEINLPELVALSLTGSENIFKG